MFLQATNMNKAKTSKQHKTEKITEKRISERNYYENATLLHRGSKKKDIKLELIGFEKFFDDEKD